MKNKAPLGFRFVDFLFHFLIDMYNPELPDKVITEMLASGEGGRDIIANKLGCDHMEVKKIMDYLESTSSHAFEGSKSGKAGVSNVHIRPSERATWSAFIKSGGYSKIEQDMQQDGAERKHDRELENRSKSAGIFSNKLMVWVSIGAGIIALGALIVEIGRSAGS